MKLHYNKNCTCYSCILTKEKIKEFFNKFVFVPDPINRGLYIISIKKFDKIKNEYI